MSAAFPKKHLASLAGSIFCMIAAILVATPSRAQVVNETTKKKFTVGIGIFNDIVLNPPAGIKIRTIDQGFHVFALYNIPIGKSPFGFSVGLGVSSHNIYGNYLVNESGDTTKLTKIPDSVSYKRSKINLTYIEVPFEFNLKLKSKFQAALGFKIGYMVSSKELYVGDGGIETFAYSSDSKSKIRVKSLGVPNVDQFAYGPYFRVGYKWIAVDGYYMINSIFTKNHGPDMSVFSIGLAAVPF